MKRIILLCSLLALPLAAQQYKIAIAGLGHSHVNSHLGRILKSDEVKLVGIWETEPSLIEQAKKRGATDVPYFSDLNTMLGQTKPDIVWAFTPTYQHLDVVQTCAPRKISVMVEKP
ncbi:MAG: Gfo/Idh/MocA family oxidoreductase, partial [Acidobacteria bacterium]|nr:Gfo/Idh/MocA family oxidoreductase [Acidobacteriota bacterium]